MGGSTSKFKRWMGSREEDVGGCEKAVKRLATPFVYTRRGSAEDNGAGERSVKRLATPYVYTRKGSMYFDEDGDVAHEFYEEVPPLRRGVKATMRKILTNLTPQGDVRLPFPCLHVDFPIVLYQDS
ncbi:tumor suppressor candidate 2-like [Penaeus chinensis]|uniref:tumor suppressor candidate 2-like n=1 Tax=Penaeus chinensis TaxID=139456 RepID=UPI001FB659F0|nr:tumor suppressor candidate 2-like [Penaeus chinensis]